MTLRTPAEICPNPPWEKDLTYAVENDSIQFRTWKLCHDDTRSKDPPYSAKHPPHFPLESLAFPDPGVQHARGCSPCRTCLLCRHDTSRNPGTDNDHSVITCPIQSCSSRTGSNKSGRDISGSQSAEPRNCVATTQRTRQLLFLLLNPQISCDFSDSSENPWSRNTTCYRILVPLIVSRCVVATQRTWVFRLQTVCRHDTGNKGPVYSSERSPISSGFPESHNSASDLRHAAHTLLCRDDTNRGL